MTPSELKERRKNLNLNQSELADILEVAKTTVSRWETGEARIPAMLDLALEKLEDEKQVSTSSVESLLNLALDKLKKQRER